LPKMVADDQEILAGPFVITAETGSGTIDLQLAEDDNLLLVWNQDSWQKVEEYQGLSLGTYLLVSTN
jgi:hypothetical protein